MKNLRDKVEACLKEYPLTRNNDIGLFNILLWKFYRDKLHTFPDNTLYIKLTNLSLVPKQSDVQRIRAHFQNKCNIYLPTLPEVREKRRIAEADYKRSLGYDSRPIPRTL